MRQAYEKTLTQSDLEVLTASMLSNPLAEFEGGMTKKNNKGFLGGLFMASFHVCKALEGTQQKTHQRTLEALIS